MGIKKKTLLAQYDIEIDPGETVLDSISSALKKIRKHGLLVDGCKVLLNERHYLSCKKEVLSFTRFQYTDMTQIDSAEFRCNVCGMAARIYSNSEAPYDMRIIVVLH